MNISEEDDFEQLASRSENVCLVDYRGENIGFGEARSHVTISSSQQRNPSSSDAGTPFPITTGICRTDYRQIHASQASSTDRHGGSFRRRGYWTLAKAVSSRLGSLSLLSVVGYHQGKPSIPLFPERVDQGTTGTSNLALK